MSSEGSFDETGRVCWSRSQPRDSETGEICFDLVYEGEEGWSRVPVTALMDLKDKTFEHEEVTQAINDMRAVAVRWPHRRRNCICCRRKAWIGQILCSGCSPKYGETVEAE